MIFEAILNEVDQLHSVSQRLEELAEQHPTVSKALMTIAGSIRNTQRFWLCWLRLKLLGQSKRCGDQSCSRFLRLLRR